MARLLLLACVLLTAAYLLSNRIATNPLSAKARGQEVTVESPRMKAHFQRGAGLDESYMLFGGDASEKSGHFSNVLLSGLAGRHVSVISQRYPDFTMCRSPGAHSAQQLIETLGLIATDGKTRGTLLEALRLHDQSLAGGGERACLHLRGEQLHLRAAYSLPAEVDVTEPVRQGHRGVDFYLIDHAEIVPCQTLTR